MTDDKKKALDIKILDTPGFVGEPIKLEKKAKDK